MQAVGKKNIKPDPITNKSCNFDFSIYLLHNVKNHLFLII